MPSAQIGLALYLGKAQTHMICMHTAVAPHTDAKVHHDKSHKLGPVVGMCIIHVNLWCGIASVVYKDLNQYIPCVGLA